MSSCRTCISTTAGNHDLFPKARYHVQDAEMAYCTGRCMCHAYLRPRSITKTWRNGRQALADRVSFTTGLRDRAEPDRSQVGGHSKGLQVVRVLTNAAGSCSVRTRRTSTPTSNSSGRFRCWRAPRICSRATRNAASCDFECSTFPGHDPLVLQRYPAALGGVNDIVRLDLRAPDGDVVIDDASPANTQARRPE